MVNDSVAQSEGSVSATRSAGALGKGCAKLMASGRAGAGWPSPGRSSQKACNSPGEDLDCVPSPGELHAFWDDLPGEDHPKKHAIRPVKTWTVCLRIVSP